MSKRFSDEQIADIRAEAQARADKALAEIVNVPLPAAGVSAADWVRGASKSWTVWAGVALVVLPVLTEVLAPIAIASIGPEAWRLIVQGVGVLMILLRAKTNASLPERGAA